MCVINVLQEMGAQVSDDELRELIAEVDINKNATIEEEEFLQVRMVCVCVGGCMCVGGGVYVCGWVCMFLCVCGGGGGKFVSVCVCVLNI